jgi:hypothetical protein
MEYHIREAEALFARFAERHRLSYEVSVDPPIEVLWTFPVQEQLAFPITLGLQNGDELNFGVTDFWSYFFPFHDVSENFEGILDAWVVGQARIAVMRGGGRLLQVREADVWRSVYGANGCLFPFRRWPRHFMQNRPASPIQ